MSMPGFTAEASLDMTKQGYRTGKWRGQAKGGVLPAVIFDPDCVDACVNRCAGSRLPQACFNHCFRRCPVLTFPPLPGFEL